MKKILIALTLLTALFSVNASMFEEEDKQEHMAVSAIGANLMYAYGLTATQAFMAMLTIGLLKEAYDKNHGASDNSEHTRDLFANALGSATVFIWELEF